jgi:hypothetical protein
MKTVLREMGLSVWSHSGYSPVAGIKIIFFVAKVLKTLLYSVIFSPA